LLLTVYVIPLTARRATGLVVCVVLELVFVVAAVAAG